MKIALVDFDLVQTKSMSATLAKVGHECHALDSSAAWWQQARQDPYDALVVNLQRRDENAGLVKAVRAHMPAPVPILCVTGSDSEDEIIASLDAGANDYLFRPMRHRDLVTRLVVLLRRAYPSQAGSDQLHISPYVFELRWGRLTMAGKVIDVTRKEFDLALLFLRNLGRPLSRAFILETIWQGQTVENSRTMDTHVSRVRNKLGLVPQRGFRLSPVYGFGYRLDPVKPTEQSDFPNHPAR